ncbi:asparagine synthase-related protein [Sphingomonas baiyangensis]|uniref:asparagine synthase (glutamine-hydrolyzing) n=1 Tax=Sphingomonas baiyangensis TaxID=2572576 RepID=A0A4V5PWG9_9SPHN|nr:asparagine synthetase B family protein [Sphingomonas baiyangensis]TKD51578.1 hypothetical protein FBR43_13045 [Sphingomonas baiyangensis]
MKNGVYALASLDNAPLDPSDLRSLSFGPRPQLFFEHGCAIDIRDGQNSAIHFAQMPDGPCALLGHLDEPHEVADRLGLDRNAGSATLAAMAHVRWGADMATKLLGEWLMMRWHIAARRMTLVMGECIRDHCYFTTDGARVALSPNLSRLTQLSWVSGEFDPEMMLRSMGTYNLREGMCGRTIIKDVFELRSGEEIIVDAHGVQRRLATPAAPPPKRRIAFTDAIIELRETMLGIMTQQLRRGGAAAFMLSGGLDSSLLSALGTLALPPEARMLCLTSAAPIDSSVADETKWASLVSAHLDVPMLPVRVNATRDIYRPTNRTFSAFETPLQSPRHYLYEALEDAAHDHGCDLLIDGLFGELTVSNVPAIEGANPRHRTLRRWAAAIRDAMGQRTQSDLDDQFLVRLSPDARPAHPLALVEPVAEGSDRVDDGTFGVLHGAAKAAGQPSNCSIPALRCVYPFRDRRLIRLMAGYPAAFASYGNQNRAPIRHMMRDLLPDAIVQRTSKLSFSPTHALLMRQHAGQAIARMTDDPVDAATRWLDTAWLRNALLHIEKGGPISNAFATQVQMTAAAVEFFRWWQSEALAAPR